MTCSRYVSINWKSSSKAKQFLSWTICSKLLKTKITLKHQKLKRTRVLKKMNAKIVMIPIWCRGRSITINLGTIEKPSLQGERGTIPILNDRVRLAIAKLRDREKGGPTIEKTATEGGIVQDRQEIGLTETDPGVQNVTGCLYWNAVFSAKRRFYADMLCFQHDFNYGKYACWANSLFWVIHVFFEI